MGKFVGLKSIKIRNFRAIVSTEINLNDFNVFVGLNDVGKSTILKALNLFFNGETDPGVGFDFKRDFSNKAPFRKRKAKEVKIGLEIEAPSSYNPKASITWTKVWREEGIRDDLEQLKYSTGEEFESKKKIRNWVSNIRFS